MAKIDFTALICSRLCHDLVSPVGALRNGLELLESETDPSMREEVMDLVTSSADQTTRKLQFFRMAFGASGDLNSLMDLGEAGRALESYLADAEVSLHWACGADRTKKNIAKLLLNLALVASEALIRGGSLSVELQPHGTGYDVNVSIEGDRIILRDDVVLALTSEIGDQDLTPQNAPAHMVWQIAHDHGGSINVQRLTDGRILFSCVLKLN